MTGDAIRAGAILTVDLDAAAANWRLLSSMAGRAECAAVVKADAYGLGAAEISAALEAAGCRTFFVAHIEEGIDLRRSLGPASRVFVLNGTPAGTERVFVEARLIPVINSLGELSGWRSHARGTGERAEVALQLDTGMSRLGLASADVAAIADDPALLAGLSVELIMSHLACAEEPGHPANEGQKAEFDARLAMLPRAPASLANSSATFLGQGFHFDLIRPGAALYGINPVPGLANPMRQVAALSARVLQVREVPAGTGVGYGHAARAGRASKLATVSLGYADGWPRAASVSAFFRGQALPFVGRVSMDSIVVDATDCTEAPRQGGFVDLVCPAQTMDDIARAAGTIGYEILTRLGKRLLRNYPGPAAQPG